MKDTRCGCSFSVVSDVTAQQNSRFGRKYSYTLPLIPNVFIYFNFLILLLT